MEASWLVLMLAGCGAVAGVRYWLGQRRRSAFQTMATQLALDYSAWDIYGLLGSPFPLFAKGDGRGIEHVLSGGWHGEQVHVFDYWYYDESSDSKGGRGRTYHRFECAVVGIQAWCSPIVIERENLLTRAAGGLGFHDIEFESDSFNRAFNVRATDRKFAYDFVDGRMMRFLLETPSGMGFEAAGNQLMVRTRRLPPVQIVPLIGTAASFRAHVPRVVSSLYGPSTSG